LIVNGPSVALEGELSPTRREEISALEGRVGVVDRRLDLRLQVCRNVGVGEDLLEEGERLLCVVEA
jgi:hypothetical protein